VPVPERAEPAPEEPAAAPAAPPSDGTTAYPADDDIRAVHRPGGVWAPVAVAADLLVLRPIGFVSLFAGGAAFVVTSPVRAAIGTLGDDLDALAGRAENVFTRPLGAL
jgi:hypothetical protein